MNAEWGRLAVFVTLPGLAFVLLLKPAPQFEIICYTQLDNNVMY